MTTPNEQSDRISIDVASELCQRLAIAAAARDLSVPDYVDALLRKALASEERDGTAAENDDWSRLSARAFARDWDSEEDEAYDRLA